MAAFKKIKEYEIPFIMDGKTIFKTVTKNTTCYDVIKNLQNVQTTLAIYECVEGVEKEMAVKTKLLKVWRTHRSAKKVEFVIRKSQMVSKEKKSSNKLSSACNNYKQSEIGVTMRKELSKNTLKQVSDLAFYVRYQKTKLQTLKQQSDINSGAREQNRLMRKMTSNASVNSMDAFLAKVDLTEMAKFLSFCGEVTSEKLGGEKSREQSKEKTSGSKIKQSTTSLKHGKQVICDSLKSTKLGLKRKFSSKKTVERTISTGTVSSTDTGYHSVGSECEHLSATRINRPKRHIPHLSNLTDEPRHSTPIIAPRPQKRKADEIDRTINADTTLVPESLEQMNEAQGKSVILQRFMADQTLPVSVGLTGNDERYSQDVKRRRMERYSMPVFNRQTNMKLILWENNCKSDSKYETEFFESSEILNTAFNDGKIDYSNTFNSKPRTLRRESAISNLNRFSLVSRNFDIDTKETMESQPKTLRRETTSSNVNRFSLLSRDIGMDTSDESNGFDYSFDCSFPRMDETKSEDFSMDFSCDFDESENECDSETVMKPRSIGPMLREGMPGYNEPVVII